MIAFVLIFFVIESGIAQHFTPIWPNNPYNPMSIIVAEASINGVAMESGDEIAVFDIGDGGASICVGTQTLTGTPSVSNPVIVTAGQDESGGGITGFTPGHTIVYKLWDQSEATEITIVVPTYNTFFDLVYTSFGTAYVTSLLGSSAVETSISTLITCPGNISIPVNVENLTDITEFSLTLNIGTTLSYTGYQNAHSELSGGSLAITDNAGVLTITWSSTTPANILSDTLVELLITAPIVYGDSIETMSWSESLCYYENSAGLSMGTIFDNGFITINPIPVDGGVITGADEVCQGTTGETYQITAITNATSYIWELNPTSAGTINGTGISININFEPSFIGQATLSVYGSNTCGDGNPSSVLIDVIGTPLADAGLDTTICENSSYLLSGSAMYQQSVVWSSSGDGTFDDATSLTATYTPGSGDIATGSATLTLTSMATSPCSINTTDQMVITIQLSPTSDAGSDAVICENSSYSLSGVSTNYQSILWTSPGDGVFDDNTLLSPVYTPGPADIQNGTVDLTLTAYGISPCSTTASSTMTLTIQESATADAGSDATVCENNSYTLSGVANNHQSIVWTTSGDGTFSDTTLLNAQYTPGINDLLNGSIILTLRAYGISPCAYYISDNMTLSIQYAPTADAGSDASICENSTYTLNGSVTNEQSVLWSSSGDGTFNDATSLTATYTPGSGDVANGSATLTLTSIATSPCLVNATDTMLLTIHENPTVNAGINDTIAKGLSTTLNGSVTGGDMNYSYLWSPATGLNSVNLIDPIATPIESTNYTLTVTDGNGCSGDDEVEIVVFEHFETIWTGNPYQPMTILITSATLDGIDLVTGDEVGIFDVDGSGNEICVGFGIVSDTATATNPISITVSADDPGTPMVDGFTTGHTIRYRAWPSAVDVEYIVYTATYNSSFDESFTPLGTAIAEVFFISTITQTIALNTGWNIMSFYVAPDDMNLLNILQPLINSNELTKVINETGGFIQYIPGIGWMNTIGNMANTEGYYIKTSANTTLESNGLAIASPVNIPLSTGWNIMGYPFEQSQNAVDALQPIIATNELTKVINESGGFIQYIPGIGWMNTIGNFQAGEGYYIKVNSSTNLPLTAPVTSAPVLMGNTIPASQFFQKTWVNNPYFPMNILVMDVDLGDYVQSPNDEIAVFDGEYCVGTGVVNEDVDEPIYIVVAMDDPSTENIDGYTPGNGLTFKYMTSISLDYVEVEAIEISTINSFEPLETYICELKTSATGIGETDQYQEGFTLNLFPNPTSENTTLELINYNQGDLTIVLYDLYGRAIHVVDKEELKEGSHTYHFELSWLTPGIYTIQVINRTYTSSYIQNLKLIICE